MMWRKLIVMVLVLLSGFSLTAQQDYTLYNMPFIPQATYLNAGTMPNAKINIGLPLISSYQIYAGNSGFAYRDAIQKRADDSLTFNMAGVLDKLKTRNLLNLHSELDLLSFGFRVKDKHYFSFNATEKIDLLYVYPADFMRLVWEGNGQSLLGRRADMDGLGIDFTHYREYGFGYMREVNEKLRVGGKLKYLYGMENVWTKTSNLGLTTDSVTYDLALDGELDIRSSGISRLSDSSLDFQPGKYLFGLKNRGIGADIGAHYAVNDQLGVSASLSNIGFISWKEDLSNFSKDQTVFEFTGFDLETLYEDNDNGEGAITQLTDSIKNAAKLDSTFEGYTTWLRPQLLLGGHYKLNKGNDIGVLLGGQFTKGIFRPSSTVSYNFRLKQFISTSVSWSVYNRSYFNFGFGMSINLGPVQLYLVSDNAASLLYPERVKNVNLRTGINLTIGRDKKKKEPEPEIRMLAQVDNVTDRKEIKQAVELDSGLFVFDGISFRDSLYFVSHGFGKKMPDSLAVAAGGDTVLVTKSTHKKIDFEWIPKIPVLYVIDSLGNVRKVARMRADGTFLFENLPSDQNYLFRLEGDDSTLGDDIVIVFKNDTSETTITANRKNGFMYEYLAPTVEPVIALEPVDDTELGPPVELVIIDAAGKVLATAIRQKDGTFRFENLPADRPYLFQIRGDDTFLDRNILVVLKNGDEEVTLVASKKGQAGFLYEYLPANASNIEPEPNPEPEPVIVPEPEPVIVPEPEPVVADPVPEPLLEPATEEHELFWTVQIGLYSREVPNATFRGLTEIKKEFIDGGLVRYYSGRFSNAAEALAKREELVKLIPDAWVVAYYNGKRLTKEQAEELIQRVGKENIKFLED